MPEPIAFAEWRPDLSDRQNPAAEAKGCISQAGQYAPFPDIQDYGPASQVDAQTNLLLHFDGPDGSTTARDDSPNPKTLTAVGNAQIDTAESKFGGASGLFDGTGDYFSMPDAADLELGSGDWTIESWFNYANAGTASAICGKGDDAFSAAGSAFLVRRETTNVMSLRVSNGSATTTVTGTTQFTNAINPGWHHVAAVRTGDTLKLFLDGVQEGGDQAFTGSVNNVATALFIGARPTTGTDFMNGWLDEFRFSIGIARWTANFTPPTNPYHFGAGAEDVVLGADTFYDDATDPHIFFGDDRRLYTLESRMAVDVSKAGLYNLLSDDTWQFAQFGNNVVAVSRAVPPQRYIMGTDIDFSDLPEAPNGATSVARVNDFLMMGKDFTVHWPAFNNIAEWTPDPGTQAGNQELDQERGEIISLIGLDYAAIFQERGVRRAIYVGPPVIWDFGQDYVEKARGCIARNAATPFGRLIYYAADDGFYVFDGQASAPIGHGKVDNYFTRNLNYPYRHKISVGIDYTRKIIVWACPMGSSQFPNELLIFSVQDGRWTHDVIDLEFVFDSPAEPFTVDNFATLFPSDNLDDPTIDPNNIDSSAFDDRRIRIAAFQAGNHQMGMFNGPARAATIETIEAELAPGQRGLVTEVWPSGDMQQGAVSASIGYRRALPGAAKVYTSATQMNRVGFCPQRIDARFGSVRLNIAAGAAWRKMEGVHATGQPTGAR